jgi:hypothetical protein
VASHRVPLLACPAVTTCDHLARQALFPRRWHRLSSALNATTSPAPPDDCRCCAATRDPGICPAEAKHRSPASKTRRGEARLRESYERCRSPGLAARIHHRPSVNRRHLSRSREAENQRTPHSWPLSPRNPMGESPPPFTVAPTVGDNPPSVHGGHALDRRSFQAAAHPKYDGACKRCQHQARWLRNSRRCCRSRVTHVSNRIVIHVTRDGCGAGFGHKIRP